MANDPFSVYLTEINKAYMRGDATEHTHRPTLKRLIESLGKKITATNEPKRIECGAPDYSVSRRLNRLDMTIGYIEAKDIGTNLSQAAKSEQIKKRYLPSLHNFILTDYISFRWYIDGEIQMTARLAKEGKGGAFVATEKSIGDGQELLGLFLQQGPVKIKGPKELAKRMAGMARLLRDIIEKTFEKEAEEGTLHGQFEAFRAVLLHDLNEKQFADMYAQTISYGLFSARCHIADMTIFGKDKYAAFHGMDDKAKELTREHAAYLLPKTNPFFRDIFSDIAGPKLDDRIVWIVDDLVELLKQADMGLILRDFARRKKRKDPVFHFYETFLAEYDPKLKKSRGVYYTPEPVVSYIVRSVDWILKNKFGLKRGLADNSKIKVKVGKDEKEFHRCLVLDPAAGTGTFLYEVIKQIQKNMSRQKGAWSDYVKIHLLPRIFGFELMMAPYTVCHMKLGLELADSGYDFQGNDRLGVYLTNTLEEAEDITGFLGFARDLAEEAQAANEVKIDMPVMVVLGNPPYSYESVNKGKWISKLVKDYYQFDGKSIGERNPKGLQDDYVKFIRFGQHRIEQTGNGILAFITNHSYLDNPTFRGMRQQLREKFTDIYVLDLHGNYKKKEVCPNGSKDENVFDIQQGVSIAIFIKNQDRNGQANIYRKDIWGIRKEKYKWLSKNDIKTTNWEQVSVNNQSYLFKIYDYSLFHEYEKFYKLNEIFPINSVGLYTARDHFAIQYSGYKLHENIKVFIANDTESARKIFNLGKDSRDWQVLLAQNDIKSSNTVIP